MARRQKAPLRAVTADERAALEQLGRAGSERADCAARAKALLVAGHLPLTQIATEVGFANQSHLTRHFARLVGATPGQYVRDSR